MGDKGALFNDLAQNFPSDNYSKLCTALGVGYDEGKAQLKRFKQDYRGATRHLFGQWEIKREKVDQEELEGILKKADAGGLCYIVDKHFKKDNSNDQMGHSADSPESDEGRFSGEECGPSTLASISPDSSAVSGIFLENADSLFNELAQQFLVSNYWELCTALGFTFPEGRAVLSSHTEEFKDAVRELLGKWNMKHGKVRTKEELERALVEADVGGMCKIVSKHFPKGTSKGKLSSGKGQEIP